MKYIKCFAILSIALLSTFASATVKIKNSQQVPLCYELNNGLREAKLMPAEKGVYKGNIEIPDMVTYQGNTYKVTAIEEKAFFECRNLLEVTIPQYITQIGGHAFKGCNRLKIVNFNATNCMVAADNRGSIVYSAFEDCKAIVRINFGANVTYIPEYTFWGCTGLTEITIPEKVQSIGGAAFIDCSSVSKVTINAMKCVSMYSKMDGRIIPAFIGNPITTIKFGPLVTLIPDYAFFGCKTLMSVTIPENITMLGGGAFVNCNNLTHVEFNAKNCKVASSIDGENITPAFNNRAITRVDFGKNVTTIPDFMFWGCTGLTDITFGESLESIGMSAFNNCISLRSITIPETVESIGGRAFAGCRNLRTVNFNAINCVNMMTIISNIPCSAFDNKSIVEINFGQQVENIPDYAFTNCENLKIFTIPETTKHIGFKAFYGCKALQSVTIPENIKTIGGLAFVNCPSLTTVNFNAIDCVSAAKIDEKEKFSAFNDCRSITSVIFSDSVQVIPDYMLNGCHGLISINIPQSVKSIGDNAFINCYNLSNVVFDAAECKETKAFSFMNIKNIILGEHVKALPNNIFNGCSRLDFIVLPKTLQAIGRYAFKDCTSLKDITIPENIKTIEGGAFENCRNLMTVNYNATNAKTILYDTDSTEILPIFQNARVFQVIFGNNVKSVPNHLFYGCRYLENIKLNKNIEEIGQYAFAENKLLKDITIPENVKYIGGGAFENCKILSTIHYNAIKCTSTCNFDKDSVIIYPFSGKNHIEQILIGKKVEKLPEGIFHNSQYLESIIIPKNIKSIGGLAFANCPKLAEVTFDAPQCMNTHSVVDHREHGPFEGSDRLAQFIFGAKVTKIPDYILNNCTNLKKVTLTEKITEIGNFAFQNCIDLKRITLPEKLITIGEGAFKDSGITNISLGEFITAIGDDAFKGCKSLASLRIKKDNTHFVLDGGTLYSEDKERVIFEPNK